MEKSRQTLLMRNFVVDQIYLQQDLEGFTETKGMLARRCGRHQAGEEPAGEGVRALLWHAGALAVPGGAE